MRLVLGLLSFLGLCAGTFLDVHIESSARFVPSCSGGRDVKIPVSASWPPENLVLVNELCGFSVGATIFSDGELAFYMNRSRDIVWCISNSTTLAPCTIYLMPDLATFYVVKPTGMYPDCSAPNSLLLAAPTPVTTEPTIDVLLSGGIAASAGYCTGYVYIYYAPPQETSVTTVGDSVGGCAYVRYTYTVESNGDITHYMNSSGASLLSCRTTAANSSCTASVTQPDRYYSYTVSVLRYGAVTRPIGNGTCGLSLAPTASPTTASLAPTAPPTTAPTSPTAPPTAPTAPTSPTVSLAPTAPTPSAAPTSPTAPTVSLAPTSNSIANGAVGMVRLLPGLLFSPLSVLFLV